MNCIYMLFQAMLIFEFFLTSITFMSPIFWFNNFWTLFPNNGSVRFNKFSIFFSNFYFDKNFTTMENLQHYPARVECDFL